MPLRGARADGYEKKFALFLQTSVPPPHPPLDTHLRVLEGAKPLGASEREVSFVRFPEAPL